MTMKNRMARGVEASILALVALVAAWFAIGVVKAIVVAAVVWIGVYLVRMVTDKRAARS